MASPRLTTQLRANIIDNALVGAFKKEREANRQARIEITGDIYRTIVTEEQEKAMKKLPAGFFHTGSDFSHMYLGAEENGKSRFTLSYGATGRLVPASHYSSYTVIDKKLRDRADKIEAMDKSINERTDELRDKISQVVASVNTVAKLIEIWPEAEAFIPVASAPAKSNLPAVIVKDLMAALMSAKGENPNPIKVAFQKTASDGYELAA